MNPFTLLMLVCLSALLITGCKDDDDPMPDPDPMMDPNPVDMETQNYELWITDQVHNTVVVFDGKNGEEKAVIDMALEGGSKPHMILFSPDNKFAYVACVGGDGTTIIVRTSDYKVLETLQTGKSSHAAIPTWDGTKVWVAVIAEFKLVEIEVDADNEKFTISRELDLAAALPDLDDFPASKPICHMFTPDDAACYVTLAGGGLVVVDVAEMKVIKEFNNSKIDKNGCGLVNGPSGSNLMFANSGLPESGSFYVFNSKSHDLLMSQDVAASTGNMDSHGVAMTRDDKEMWMINRLTDNIMVFDIDLMTFTETFEVADAPDLLVFSPGGTKAYMTLRGDAQTGGDIAHAISGGTPGYAVIDVATKTVEEVIQFGPAESSDPHGIGLLIVE